MSTRDGKLVMNGWRSRYAACEGQNEIDGMGFAGITSSLWPHNRIGYRWILSHASLVLASEIKWTSRCAIRVRVLPDTKRSELPRPKERERIYGILYRRYLDTATRAAVGHLHQFRLDMLSGESCVRSRGLRAEKRGMRRKICGILGAQEPTRRIRAR